MEPSLTNFIVLWTIACCCMVVCVEGDEGCNRDRSTVVRQYIRDVFYPVFNRHGATVAEACPLNPRRDLFAFHESQKLKLSNNEWSCLMCGKSFYSEHYLDQHMHNRHTDTQQYQADSVCLADYCDVMRCDLLMHAQLPTDCDEGYMTELRIQCHSLVRECRPEKLEKNMTVEEFEDELQEAMCPYLTCERYFEHPGLRGYGHLVIIYFIVIMCIFGVVLLICYLAFDAVQEEQNSHRRYYVRVPEDDSDNDYNYSADYDYDSVTRSPFHQVQSLRSRIHAAGDDT